MKTKKQDSTQWILMGLLLIAAALGLIFYNIYEDDRAQSAAAQVVNQLEEYRQEIAPETTAPQETEPPPSIPQPVRAMPARKINGQEYIGTLRIPRYELELPVISELTYPRLKIAPCRYKGSVYTDDLIISAHNYRSHFGLIVELDIGDEVLFTDMTGKTVSYTVVLQETLQATDIEKMSAGEWDLTLFTCTIGGKYRVTVRCDRTDTVDEEALKKETARLAEEKPSDGIGSRVVEKRVSPPEELPEETETMPAETEPVPTEPDWDTVPLYFQNDYPNTMYGSGTIESSGCSITALAMVATYLTEHEYLPDELARYFGGRAENNIARMEQGAETLQLGAQKAKNWDYTYAALKEGKVAIVLMESNSLFTSSQHFIVLTGLTEDGKVLVNDPYLPNYDSWLLRDGFANGFEQKDIILGYSGAWLFDKASMPEEPYIHFEPEPDRSNPRYPQIELTYSERRLLACVVWAEARGESAEGQQAVAEVVLNRMASENFPDDLHDVIYGEGQFRTVSVLKDAEPSQAQYEAIEKAIYGPYVLPEDVVYFARHATNNSVWGRIGGHIFCYGKS